MASDQNCTCHRNLIMPEEKLRMKAYRHHSSQTHLPLSKFHCNGSMRYAEYEVVLINGITLKKSRFFVTLGKGQFKVMVKIKSYKHIYIIPAKHSYHYLSSIVVGL